MISSKYCISAGAIHCLNVMCRHLIVWTLIFNAYIQNLLSLLMLNHIPCFLYFLRVCWLLCSYSCSVMCGGISWVLASLLMNFPEYVTISLAVQLAPIYLDVHRMWICTCYAITLSWKWSLLLCVHLCICMWLYVLSEHVCVHTQLYTHELVHSASCTLLFLVYTIRLSIQSIL